MPKVTGPLFGTSAHGRVINAGSFRRRGETTIFQRLPPYPGEATPKQAAIRACFAAARTAWAASPQRYWWASGVLHHEYITPWAVWWDDWRANHPECNP